MTVFSQPEPNHLVSDEGSIRIRGRAGLDVEYAGRSFRVSSEMLDAPMSIALFPRDSDTSGLEDPEELFSFVTNGLESAGFTVERV